LLDENLIAKVSDFGISKENEESFTHISTRPAGTAGYLDPEYFLRRQLTTASDVYGYGVLLLEIVTGQQAIDHMRSEEMNLIRWVRYCIHSSNLGTKFYIFLDSFCEIYM
jgi:serine/threonine protein kinase